MILSFCIDLIFYNLHSFNTIIQRVYREYVTNAKIQKSEAKNRNCTHKPKIREQKFEQHDQGARIACVHRKTQVLLISVLYPLCAVTSTTQTYKKFVVEPVNQKT